MTVMMTLQLYWTQSQELYRKKEKTWGDKRNEINGSAPENFVRE